MASIDQRVVEMKFNNNAFLSGVSSTISALANLTKSLGLSGGTKGLEDVNKAAGKFSVAGMQSSLASAASSFSALQVAGVAALATLVSKATTAGLSMAKSLTIAPISGGLKEYELKLNTIQTILANTAAAGTTLKQVNTALNDLNKYSDQTIYNFGEMAKNIGTFTAAGVDLDTSVKSIKGLANIAALSGASSEKATGAMYQLSQAISAGRVGLEDWNSVVKADMGGAIFQRALSQTAVAMGALPKEAVKLEGAMKNVKIEGKSFRDSIMAKPGEKSWLTSEVLTTTLKNFTGDMTKAQIVAQGFSSSAADGIIAQAKAAKDAATVVKTGTQLMSTLRESSESGWAATWEIIIGDFEQAKKLYTGVYQTLSGLINASSDFRNRTLTAWKDMGGRAAVIEGIRNAFNALMAVLKPIKDAFRDIFPAKTGKDLYEMSLRFQEFTEKLKIGPETADLLKRSFAGVFAIFSIGVTIIKAVLSAIGDLFGTLSKGDGGGLLNLTAGLGDFLVGIDQMLKKSGVIKTFFATIASVLAVPIKLIQALAKGISGIFSGGNDGANKTKGTLDGVSGALQRVQDVSARVGAFFDRVGEKFRSVGKIIGDALSGIGPAMLKVFNGANFDRLIKLVQTGLLGGLLVVLNRFSKGLNLNFGGDGGGGFLDSITGALDGLTGALRTMQADVKSNIILKIAISLGILAAAMFVLSTISGADLAKSIGALAAGMAILAAGLIGLSNSIGLLGALKLPFIAAGMLLISVSLLAIAVAMKIMASMSFEEIHRGIVAIAGALTAIAIAMRLMPKNMLLQSVAITALSVALIALAVAMKIFATMKYEEIGRGLVALGGALVVIGLAMRVMPNGASMILQAAGLTILAVALGLMAASLKLMATMSIKDIATSLGVLAGSLLIIAVALKLMPGGATMILQAAALVAISAALNLMSLALKIFGGMSVEEIAKSLIVLAGSLLILAVGLRLMTGTIGGSVALVIAAAALALLVPTLISLGVLDWSTIVKGLAALAGVFVVLGVAGLVIGPLVPVILGLGASMVLLGAGLLLAGVGMLAVATAFGIVVSVGVGGVKVLADILKTFITAIPLALEAFGKGIIALAVELAKGTVAMTAAFSAFLTAILQSIIKNAPLIGQAFTAIVVALLKAITDIAPKIGAAITAILMSFLKVIVDNAPKIALAITAILTAFLKVITDSAPKIALAIGVIMTNMLKVVVENAPKMGTAFLALITEALRVLTVAIPRMADAGLKIVMGVIDAAAKNIGGIVKVATDLIVNFLDAIGKNLPRIIDSGVKLVISFINGVADAINKNVGALREAGGRLAMAIIDGMTGGLASAAAGLASQVASIAKGALDAAKAVLGINSPSKEFYKIGAWSGEGMVDGLSSFEGIVSQTAEAVGTGAVRAIRESISGLGAAVESDMSMVPVIRPIMDLSNIEKAGARIASLIPTQKIGIDTAYSGATAASAGYRSNQMSLAEFNAPAAVTSPLTFIQNNNSPKALAPAEIYRQTKNQLSVAKGALTT